MTNAQRFGIAGLLGLLAILVGSVVAQQAPVDLSYNTPVDGTLNADNRTDVYIFLGGADDTVTLVGTSEAMQIGLLLTNAQGATLGEVIADDDGVAALTRVALPATGTYFVTVFTAQGTGDYSLSLTEGAAPPSTATDTEATQEAAAPAVEETTPDVAATPAPTNTPTVELPEETPEVIDDTGAEVSADDESWQPSTEILVSGGIEVVLTWAAPVDMNLEVRDPVGNSLLFSNRETPNGGQFGFDANGLCEVVTENPSETASWAPGFLPTGSYEILVYYRQACENVGAVDFTVNVTVEGQALDPIEASLSPPTPNQDSLHVANFIVEEDGSATINQGGFYPDTSLQQLPAPPQELIAAAQPIELGTPVTGTLWEAQDYLVYSFEGAENALISVDMRRIAGNLDTMVQLVGTNGNFLEVNDDRNDNNPETAPTDSLISNYRIVTAGTYYVVATRYGKDFGGTEGEFQLTVSEGATQLPESVANLNLPDGDIEVYLTWATNADLQLLVRDPVGAAVYDDDPQINSGGVLAANGNVNCTQPEEGTPVSYIYWPSGLARPGIYEVDVWFQDTCNDPTPVDFTLTVVVNGEVVAVESQNPTIGDRFVLTFAINPDGTASAGRGGFISTAGTLNGTDFDALDLESAETLPIQYGQPVNGSITLENDFDVYSFQGTAGQAVTISMQATSRTLDTKLFLVDSTGTVATLNDDAPAGAFTGVDGRTTDSIISAYTLPSDGEYRIVATRFGTVFGGTVGDYRLTLTQVQGDS